ncbi:MAG: hypothetical protein WCJ30_27585 [Deltaproteobacteria bacterium]
MLLVVALADAVKAASAAGDLQAARIAVEALWRLLGASGEGQDAARVADLTTYRGRKT